MSVVSLMWNSTKILLGTTLLLSFCSFAWNGSYGTEYFFDECEWVAKISALLPPPAALCSGPGEEWSPTRSPESKLCVLKETWQGRQNWIGLLTL